MKIILYHFNGIALFCFFLFSMNESVRATDTNGIVGVRLTNDNNYVRITGVLIGTPAEKSQRIIPGMILLGIIKEDALTYISTRDVSADKVVELLKGPPDKQIQLELATVSDDGKPTIERVEIIRMSAGGRDWTIQPFVSQRRSTMISNTSPWLGDLKTNATNLKNK